MRLNRLFVFFALLVLGVSCKNEFPLGGENLPLKSDVRVDTLALTGLSSFPYSDYSGNLEFLTVGKVNDLAYGEISISTVFLPRLINFSTGIDTISADATYRLRMIISQTFGDTLATNEWDLFNITRTWRANEWTYDSTAAIEAMAVGSASITAIDDTIYVNLPATFGTQYHSYYYQNTGNTTNTQRMRDSLYKANVFGFSIVPRQNGSIKMFRASGVSLEIVEQDTMYSVGMNNYANVYSLTNAIDYSSTEYTPLNSFNTNFLKFDIQVVNADSLRINGSALPTRNLAKAELLFFDDTTLVNSQRPATFRNLGVSQVLAFESTPEGLSDKILMNNPALVGTKVGNTYRVNITGYINSFILATSTEVDDKQFYMTLRGNDGFYSNVILFNQTSAVYSPKIVLTYAVLEAN